MKALDYWVTRYAEDGAIKHHSTQNRTISRDFLREARQRKPFADMLSIERIMEVGCGTGELAYLIKETYNTDWYFATDFCRSVVKKANLKYPSVNFWVFDILSDTTPHKFDLAIASNVLEHFTDPSAVVERMLVIAPRVIVIVPYKQPVTDGYDDEGGAGHVSEFDESCFPTMIDWFLFKTKGWEHSSKGEEPLQMAVLLERD